MANIIIREALEGRTQVMNSEGRAQSFRIQYLVFGLPSQPVTRVIGGEVVAVPSETVALEEVRNATPAEYLGLARKEISVAERISEECVKIEVSYEKAGNQSAPGLSDETEEEAASGGTSNASEMSFESVEGTEHISYSLRTIAAVGVPACGAIGLDAKKNIAGVDRQTGYTTFRETHTLSRNTFNAKYIRKISDLRYCVNSSAFRGFDAGEVMFTGFSASQVGSGDKRKYRVTYSFTVRPVIPAQNVQGLRVPAMNGFDYFWPYYNIAADSSTGQLGIPLAGYGIERIYRWASFSALKLPNRGI